MGWTLSFVTSRRKLRRHQHESPVTSSHLTITRHELRLARIIPIPCQLRFLSSPTSNEYALSTTCSHCASDFSQIPRRDSNSHPINPLPVTYRRQETPSALAHHLEAQISCSSCHRTCPRYPSIVHKSSMHKRHARQRKNQAGICTDKG
jgi:hypothetical protein